MAALLGQTNGPSRQESVFQQGPVPDAPEAKPRTGQLRSDSSCCPAPAASPSPVLCLGHRVDRVWVTAAASPSWLFAQPGLEH